MALEPIDDFLARVAPSARSKRAKEKARKRLRLPEIKTGRSVMINTEAGEARLRELELYRPDEPASPQRGRPRTMIRGG
jgi:hypothetical protein